MVLETPEQMSYLVRNLVQEGYHHITSVRYWLVTRSAVLSAATEHVVLAAPQR
jgi:hypothetical protein